MSQNFCTLLYDTDDKDDEKTVQSTAIMTLYALFENNQRALLQFKENSGKAIVQQLLIREDLKVFTWKLLSKLKLVDDINDEDDIDQNDRERIVNERLFSNLVTHLSSKSSEVQAEAASAIKNLIDETPENLEALMESEIIPALIRTLILSDENVLEKVIETLATIISIHPSLRNLYMDLNIVESLLISYSPKMYKKMKADMVQILLHLLENDVLTLSSETEKYISPMLPCLSELIYDFDSKTIVSFIENMLASRVSDNSHIRIDVDVADKVYQLLFHRDDLIQISAFFTISFFPKKEELVQRFFENGILEFLKKVFKNDNIDSSLTYSGLLFLTEISQKHTQEIFDADLIPYMISFLNPKHNAGLRMLAVTAVYRISKHGTSTHIATLVDLNIIPKICQMLQYSLSKLDDDEKTVQSGAILTICYLYKNNQNALLQLKENNGKEIFQRLLSRKDMKEIALEFLMKLKNVKNVDDKSDRDEL